MRTIQLDGSGNLPDIPRNAALAEPVVGVYQDGALKVNGTLTVVVDPGGVTVAGFDLPAAVTALPGAVATRLPNRLVRKCMVKNRTGASANLKLGCSATSSNLTRTLFAGQEYELSCAGSKFNLHDFYVASDGIGALDVDLFGME